LRIDFPYVGYDQIAPVDVPDANLMGVFSPRAFDDVDEQAVLRAGFENPIGAPRLRDAVKPSDTVLIIIDDGTRGTPMARILPLVLEDLQAGGIPDRQIDFIQGVGTHRPMRHHELQQKLGIAYGRYRIHEHHWLDEASLHHFGNTSDGTKVAANKVLAERDFVMGIGSIVPHRVKGFSGGAKIAFPGVAGREMMEKNQWEASLKMSETVMGVAENSMRLRMEEAAKLAGLKYIVNVVGDINGKIVGCFTGDVVKAHRAGCELSGRVFAAHMPRRADIVLIDSHPADRDFWQSAKGPYAGTMAVKDGGSMIVVAPNPEGVAPNHPNVLEIGYRPHAEIVKMVQDGKVPDVVGAAILGDVCQIVDKTDCIMVSPGISQADTEKLGFRYAKTAADALKMALEKQGEQASIAVLRHGGHILPVVDDEPAGQR
jgi:nickel-dependent lactate racemase